MEITAELFFPSLQTGTNLQQKMVHYHKKNNHNVSNFLGLETARNILSNFAYTLLLQPRDFLGNYLVTIVMDTNDPAGVATVSKNLVAVVKNLKDSVGVATVLKNLVAVVKELKDSMGVATDPMNVGIGPQRPRGCSLQTLPLC